jgi:hypothetical protein
MKNAKCLLRIGLFSLISLGAFTHPSLARYPYPEINKSLKYEPICYIEMSGGRVLDLSSICGKSAVPDTAPTPYVTPTPYIAPTPTLFVTPTPPPSTAQ